MFASNAFARRTSLRIPALAALVALTAGNAAQAATTRPVNFATAAVRAAAAAKNQGSSNATLTFMRIDDPADPTFNQLLGIDDSSVISGYFGSGAAGHPNIGYTIASPYKSFVSDNLPSSTQTQATGITPTATTSGFWAPSNLGPGNDANFGFIRLVGSNGTTTWLSVNDPLVSSSPKINQVLGVNASLNAVGFYNDSKNNSHGFVYSVQTGQFSHPFVDSLAVSSAITGINNSNVISGFFTDTKGHTKGFLQSLANGAGVHYLVPGSTFTQFLGVDQANEAVGFYIGADTFPHGIVYNMKTGALTIVNAPGAAMGTTLNGINDKHQAVGFYTDAAGNTHGLLVGNVP